MFCDPGPKHDPESLLINSKTLMASDDDQTMNAGIDMRINLSISEHTQEG